MVEPIQNVDGNRNEIKELRKSRELKSDASEATKLAYQ
jgi:hypothetical protein